MHIAPSCVDKQTDKILGSASVALTSHVLVSTMLLLITGNPNLRGWDFLHRNNVYIEISRNLVICLKRGEWNTV